MFIATRYRHLMKNHSGCNSLAQRSTDKTILHTCLLVAACFSATLVIGETFHALGVFFKPLENELSSNRTSISSGYTAFMIGVAISSIVAGRLADRLNPFPILLTCAILAGGGIILCSYIHDITQLRTFYFTAGLGVGATWSVPGSVVQRWFHGKDRGGLALAIVISGVGVGGLIFAPLSNHLIISYGWRQAYLILGIITFLIISLSAFIIKNSHYQVLDKLQEQYAEQPSPIPSSWSTGSIATTLPFIQITFLVCLAELTFQAIAVHLVPHATDVGISTTSSALALGLIGGISIPGRIFSGLLSDRKGWQNVMALSLGCIALCLIWLLLLKSTWMLYIFVLFYGICHGMAMTAEVGILGEFFGMRWLGGLIGISSSIAFIAAALSPYMLGYIFDATGSYSTAYIIILGLLLLGSFVAMVMKKQSS
jgi:MFS family permease